VLKYLGAFYLFVGLGSALILKALIPAVNVYGMAWYTITWPYQALAAQIDSLPVAPSFMLYSLFNF
jgi:hypothetical protein